MASKSAQKWMGRNRPPRVQIQYEVFTDTGMQNKELPFVVGVMGDYAGMPAEPLPPLSQRKFVEIDRGNFNKVLAGCQPRLAFRVDDKISGRNDAQLSVELKFETLDDFSPENVVRQVGPMRKLLEMRERLNTLLAKMDGNDYLSRKLDEIVCNSELQERLARERGICTSETPSQPLE